MPRYTHERMHLAQMGLTRTLRGHALMSAFGPKGDIEHLTLLCRTTGLAPVRSTHLNAMNMNEN
jgi:hypothetical protein